MMPRWLQWWLGLSLAAAWFLVIVVGGSFALTTAVNSGEQPFTKEQADYLKTAYPGGRFDGPHRYRWCDGRVFIYFDARGDTWNHAEQCWKVQ